MRYCTVSGCISKYYASGFCRSHWKRKERGKELKSNLPEYHIWAAMKQRCINPKAQVYHNYGARGIKVCEEWVNSFDAFIEHVGLRPSRLHSLDRIDNNGNYEPGNVRWVEKNVQTINTRLRRNNTSGAKGVCWSKSTKKWSARIWVNKKKIVIGYFKNKQDAIDARKLAEEKYYKPLLAA